MDIKTFRFGIGFFNTITDKYNVTNGTHRFKVPYIGMFIPCKEASEKYACMAYKKLGNIISFPRSNVYAGMEINRQSQKRKLAKLELDKKKNAIF